MLSELWNRRKVSGCHTKGFQMRLGSKSDTTWTKKTWNQI